VCVSSRRQARVHASCSLCGGCQPRTSPRTCKSARQRSSASSTNIQLVLLGVNISLSHVHIHLLLLLLLVFAFSWPEASDPAPYSCHPHPHTPVTPILCTRIHASQVYEVHYGFRVVYLTYLNPQPGIRGTLRVSGAYGCEIWDILFACSNSIPPYLRTTESTSSRQPTVSATTANSAEAPPRSPAPMSTEDRSGVGGSSDGQDEQSRIVLPPETGEQPSLSSGLSDAPCLNRRRPGSPNPSSSSSSSTTTRGIRGG
jgi:hypothetical protein